MSAAPVPVTIVGGGLAGLALGIALRQRGVAATVWEAGEYPRHRVCGEFVRAGGQRVLARLGLLRPLLQAGAADACTAAFWHGRSRSPVRPLPEPGLSISRHVLDAFLARRFEELGGTLLQGRRWVGDQCQEGLVLASGRVPRATENGWRWFGLKVHARQVDLEADLEIHAWEGGYVGLCRLADGDVNVCGLFRRRSDARDPARSWQERLRGPEGLALRRRLSKARFDESTFCSVGGLSLRPRRAARQAGCRIGDALTMVHPVTGDGMSLALEAADLAVAPLCAWSRGALSWLEARAAMAAVCDAAFARRLAAANCLHWLMFCPLLRGFAGAGLLRSHLVWRLFFSCSR